MAGSLRMYAIAQTHNSEILSDTTTGGPALPTVGELNPPVTSKADWMWRGRRSLLFFPNGEFVATVKMHQHLQPLLANPASTASDIYLVTRPESIVNNPAGSLRHWSFYTQGVFYHLSAPDQPRDTTGKCHNATISRHVPCRLKCEDLSHVNSEDYIRLRTSSDQKVLLAYKVGQTDYRPDQILHLAQWAVRQLSRYSLFSANCQHFATTMFRRTAMRVGDRSAFVGTVVQIADWDLTRGIQPHTNGIERGFVVSPPLPVDESMLSGFISTCCWLFKLRGYIPPRTIMVFYEKGPSAIGAWHPPGYYSMNFREHLKFFCRACADLKEDLSQKRWKDALYGRYKELPDGTMKRPL